MSDAEALARNLAAVRARVAAAADRAGRDPAGVTVVAVTKTAGPDVVLALAGLGHADFGENRPRDLVAKREALAAVRDRTLPPVRWHMIGHLQRNKVRQALPAADLLHSLDSDALAGVVASEAARAGRDRVPALVQVNVSGEATKGGFAPGAAQEFLRSAAARFPALELRGLMTMAPWSDDPEDARPVFRRLRELRDWARASGYLAGSELSMGMSEDFDVAVEEGATIVRVGRALVGVPPRPVPPGAPSCRT